MKNCTVCKEEKTLSDFYNSKASADGKAYRCKVCDNLAVKEYRKNNPKDWGRVNRQARLLNKYGITPEDYDNLKIRQGGVCAICKGDGFPMSPKQKNLLCVDHDHKTNKVRGLLCHNCNRGLGLFQDSVDNLETAILYLNN